MNFQKIIKSQQLAMKSMGLYTGPVDGDWGMRSIAAMAGLQHHPAYFGCDPNTSNQPLQIGMKLPQGWAWMVDEDGDHIITCSEDQLAELVRQKEEHDAEIERQRLAQIEKDELEEAERKELESKELAEKLEKEALEAEALKTQSEAGTAGEAGAPGTEGEASKSAEDLELEAMMAAEEAEKNPAPAENTQAPAAPADTEVE